MAWGSFGRSVFVVLHFLGNAESKWAFRMQATARGGGVLVVCDAVRWLHSVSCFYTATITWDQPRSSEKTSPCFSRNIMPTRQTQCAMRSFLTTAFHLLTFGPNMSFLQRRHFLLVATICEQIVLSLLSFCLIATQFQGIHYHVLREMSLGLALCSGLVIGLHIAEERRPCTGGSPSAARASTRMARSALVSGFTHMPAQQRVDARVSLPITNIFYMLTSFFFFFLNKFLSIPVVLPFLVFPWLRKSLIAPCK